MNRILASALLLLLFATALTPVLGDKDKPAPKPKIEPKADEILKKACACMADLKQFGLKIEETFDQMSEAGQKLQFTNHRKVLVRRPGRLMADSEGDTTKRHFYYDGKTITLFDPIGKTYATVEAPATLDAMFDFLQQELGFSTPAADLLFSDPYKVLTEQVEEGEYVGEHRVGNKKCHHLAFRQRGTDWQLWVDAGDKPLPLKFLITYRRLPGEPQFATVLDWDTSIKVASDAFTFKPPDGAKKIQFVTKKTPPPDKKP
ncbi:MAG TPA: DUF2092 domain-containing protein [Gemmataceae bacterium]|jgi:hypothetical protein